MSLANYNIIEVHVFKDAGNRLPSFVSLPFQLA
jgi:hypothetical protein